MSVPEPTLFTTNRSVNASFKAITVHAISQRLPMTNINIGTAYIELPNTIKEGLDNPKPIYFDPLSKKYKPDTCTDVLDSLDVSLEDYRKSIGWRPRGDSLQE
ncbi:hypothetical protein SWSSV_gp143 [White spot syndrome virus]|uniref:Wsv432 n=4 Tax=White spot syndrome virus TaxID=342409 RepID=Q8VAI1_WSSVS|nr:wsv432 [Shrimp white spot syndrome virus]YP_009220617.1 hypothetical protein SWSSV_gp143 [White spot syndrome virus]AYW76641.1 hypothetical protein [Procambarus clarkii virus]AAL33434.1 wsv432 [Shrimp white spot syndrome virus]AAL89359.1 WSSV491 [Shrimp white spot syndrome virus]AFX59809.1 wsv432 [White spot syndrome virus]ALN66265.1 hypothetical protein [White spot syndrome virus]